MPIKTATEILKSIDWGTGPPCNPHLTRLYPLSTEWLRRTGLTPTEEDLKRHEAMDIPYLAALTYPTASKEGLLLAQNWMSWLFIYDDTLDEGVDGRVPIKVKQKRENFLKILQRAPAELSTPLSIALHDIWRQIVSLSDSVWQHRFIHHTNLYLNAVEWEAENRLERSFPSEDEYLRLRIETSAVRPCFDLLMPTLNIDLNKTFWNDGKIQRLEYLATEIIVLSNDIISFPKEQASNDLHNLVLIRAAMQECDPAAVLSQVAQLVTLRIAKFRKVAKEINENSHSKDCVNYVRALEAWYIGNSTWSLNGGRYLQPMLAGDQSP